ncbi:Protein unc-50-like [Hondaea fermentalgiana]|uniref:Protein unc-50-like n=1 Tax=Hondaea fermentalgiana TaxID=2315210 RepID=A0A2R5GRS1_9STRA|nr:Protein unc-50-like [Hondaea fermentalgiana]|eukprot:GBG33586.1 Protein unc-50-like [Hondaea fermentalgiana]
MLPLKRSTGNAAPPLQRRGSNSYYSTDEGFGPLGSSHFSMLRYLRRVVYYPQMDFEYTFTQMKLLLRSPSKVYKITSWRNQTKNRWARDDPAFLVILCVLISVSSVIYGLALGRASVASIVSLVATQIVIFLGSGMLIATFFWRLANARFRARHSHSVDQEVEWMYAFDIHCNAYFPMTLALYVLQLCLLPVLLRPNILSTLAANTLYTAAFSYYHYVSFLGYMYLPFLDKKLVTALLYPVALLAVAFVLFTVLNINMARLTLSLFFPLSVPS